MGRIHMNVGVLPMPLAWHMLELQYFSAGFCGQETSQKEEYIVFFCSVSRVAFIRYYNLAVANTIINF
jgi:hypothetical protein